MSNQTKADISRLNFERLRRLNIDESNESIDRSGGDCTCDCNCRFSPTYRHLTPRPGACYHFATCQKLGTHCKPIVSAFGSDMKIENKD
jgi:hypothetical protein